MAVRDPNFGMESTPRWRGSAGTFLANLMARKGSAGPGVCWGEKLIITQRTAGGLRAEEEDVLGGDHGVGPCVGKRALLAAVANVGLELPELRVSVLRSAVRAHGGGGELDGWEREDTPFCRHPAGSARGDGDKLLQVKTAGGGAVCRCNADLA